MWEHGPLLKTPQPLVAGASQAREQAIAVGLKGSAVRVIDGHASVADARPPIDFWSAAIDGTGAAWAGASGSLWHQAGVGQAWSQAFVTPQASSDPFTSLFADVGRVVGMTRDGAVIEGRTIPRTADSRALAPR